MQYAVILQAENGRAVRLFDRINAAEKYAKSKGAGRPVEVPDHLIHDTNAIMALFDNVPAGIKNVTTFLTEKQMQGLEDVPLYETDLIFGDRKYIEPARIIQPLQVYFYGVFAAIRPTAAKSNASATVYRWILPTDIERDERERGNHAKRTNRNRKKAR